MPRLRENVRNQAIGMHLLGLSNSEISKRVGCHNSTISRLVTTYQQTGDVKDRPRSDQPRVTTRRQDVNIRVIHLRNRFLPASKTARETIGRHRYENCTSVKFCFTNFAFTAI